MRLIPFLQGTCFILIEASRFAASSLLIVLGLPLFAFLFLAGWDMGLLFAQLGNLDRQVVRAAGKSRAAVSRRVPSSMGGEPDTSSAFITFRSRQMER